MAGLFITIISYMNTSLLDLFLW